jgi:hypothetical protein
VFTLLPDGTKAWYGVFLEGFALQTSSEAAKGKPLSPAGDSIGRVNMEKQTRA